MQTFIHEAPRNENETGVYRSVLAKGQGFISRVRPDVGTLYDNFQYGLRSAF